MAKVAVISTIFPFPVDNGKRVVLAGLVKYFTERFGPHELSYLLINSNYPKSSPLIDVRHFSPPRALEQIRQVGYHTLLRSAKSLQESVLFSPRIAYELHRQLAQLKPDLVICDTLRTGQYFETELRPTGRYLLYMDDLFSVRYEKMLTVLKQLPGVDIDPLGNFATFIPKTLHPLAKAPLLQRALLEWEQRLISSREQGCLKWFEKNLLINDHEARLLRDKSGQANVYPIKPLLPISRKPLLRHPTDPPVFIFLGALNVPHNRVSLMHFLEKQLPRIRSLLPRARIKIVGKGADSALLKLTEQYPDTLQLIGFVEDLDALFADATAMLIPLKFGSGVKIKTLEALARGLPVIATDFGVEGIPVKCGEDCLVINDFDDYPQAMLDLIDLDYNHKLSENAHSFFWRTYAPEVVYREYDGIFEEV
jgi:glycosyltransferase involved in cell wall biosynthesis